MLLFSPHSLITAEIKRDIPSQDSNLKAAPSWTPRPGAKAFPGMVDPQVVTQNEQHGTWVTSLRSPHWVYTNVNPDFHVDDHILELSSGRVFMIKQEPQRYEFGTELDHWRTLVDELTY